VVYNRFNFAAHVREMRRRHPEWSKRQTECCRYWQPTARKQLREELERFGCEGLRVILAPEACGVNVTATMAAVGVELEWPPKKVACQVALVGTPKRRRSG
jgi:hypothetical protein